jgi:hypothetical protein
MILLHVHDVKTVIPQMEIRPDVKRRCLWSFQDKGCDYSTIALESKSQIRSKRHKLLIQNWVTFGLLEEQ